MTLTRREHEVCDLIVDGLSDKQIGEKLGISHETVHVHALNIRKKYGVHNRVELMRKVYEGGYR